MPLVEIRGNTDLRKALRRFAPDLEKELRKELSKALRPIVKTARGFAPATGDVMTGWQPRAMSEARFPFYDQKTVQSGIGYAVSAGKITKYGFSSMARITNKSRAGAIYETAGRVGPQPWVGPNANTTSNAVSKSNWKGAGEQFIGRLGPLTLSPKGSGRLIFKAWAKNQGVADGVANRAIDKATKSFYARSKSGSLGKAL